MKYLVLSILFLCGCVSNKTPEPEISEKIVVVKGAFIYDFEGYFTQIGDYPITTNGIKDCEPYSTTCLRKEDLWFCVCIDVIVGEGEALLGIEDKTK